MKFTISQWRLIVEALKYYAVYHATRANSELAAKIAREIEDETGVFVMSSDIIK